MGAYHGREYYEAPPNEYSVNTETGEVVQTGTKGGDNYDVVTYHNGVAVPNKEHKEYTTVSFNEENGNRIAPGVFMPAIATGAVNVTDSPVEWVLEVPKKIVVKGSFMFLMALRTAGKKSSKITVIGRMDDIAGYTDEMFDTWWKSGRIPQKGEPKVTWAENKLWLDQRISRGDDFWIATDPTSLPNTKTGFKQGVANGYFTARELEYLRSKGISVLYHKGN